MTASFVPRYLDRAALRTLALERRSAYAAAVPYPHAVVDGFLGEPWSRALAEAFPGPDHPGWMRRDYREQAARLGQLQRTGFAGVHPEIRHVLAELSAMAFLDFLGTLTGVEGLIPDPHFRGAGPSLTLPGGHLALHADFNRDRARHLERKVTVLYYLGDPEGGSWPEAWGGALELWDEARTACVASHLPLRDRLVVMAHGDAFWHGHPAPLACPPGRFRAVISAYYYVAAPSPDEANAHGAIWV
jgi:2OG-Fe(II) oxygenase superfamily